MPFENLPHDQSIRHEFLVDVFGRYLFWALKEAVEESKALVETPDARKKLGRVCEKPYSDFATKLNSEQQRIALDFTEQALQTFARGLLVILGAQGITFLLGERHAIQFSLTAEIRDIENMNILFEEEMNRGGRTAFTAYWGHWLNQNLSVNKSVHGE